MRKGHTLVRNSGGFLGYSSAVWRDLGDTWVVYKVQGFDTSNFVLSAIILLFVHCFTRLGVERIKRVVVKLLGGVFELLFHVKGLA